MAAGAAVNAVDICIDACKKILLSAGYFIKNSGFFLYKNAFKAGNEPIQKYRLYLINNKLFQTVMSFMLKATYNGYTRTILLIELSKPYPQEIYREDHQKTEPKGFSFRAVCTRSRDKADPCQEGSEFTKRCHL